jgi:3',5'-nucleoside bisphosphate phosphatase
VLIDLHAHSTASDGTDSPAELVTAAAAAGLDVVAITDHDTTTGWAEAMAAAPPGLRLVPGAELSTVSRNGRGGMATVHLLAYLFDPAAPALVAEQARLRTERSQRLTRMLRLMVADGVPIDETAVFAGIPDGASPGRPHLARALVAAGAVGSVQEAFDRYLCDGSPYYVPRSDTPVGDAISMIVEAGGVTVLAHPMAHRRGDVISAEVIAELAGAGLTGVEVDHPDHDEATRRELRWLAGELGLVITGGSDYHGSNKQVRLAAETTTPDALEALLAGAVRAQPDGTSAPVDERAIQSGPQPGPRGVRRSG